MSEWQTYKLKNVTSKIGSGATPTGGSGAYKSEGISLIRSQNVLDYKFTDDGLAFIDDDQAYALRNVTVAANDVLLNITGDSVARCCSAPVDWLPARVNQHVAILRSNPDVMDNRFLKYSLLASKEELLIFSEIGGTRNALTKGMLEDFEILLPSLTEQKAIASVLSSLDDKVDLLHRQNKTLEAMAETLFRQWFIEEAKEDWPEVTVSSLFEVRDGTHDSPKQSAIGYPLVTSKHIGNGVIDFESCYLISDADYEKVNARSKVETGDILLSMIGTLGRTYLESNEVNYAIKNIGLFKTSQNPVWKYYIYLWLNSVQGKQFVDEHKSGSTQEYLSLGSLRGILIKSPPSDLLETFNKNVNSWFAKLHSNRQKIQTLEQLRDTLLPKLMSGEVRVQYQTEEVA
ncbi:restriction endonuclease subunit S [Acinetobacter lwoffii]|uniref:restriction endonuclease subunit S n=1 Tax=Acinetobacter lwoffii TaxID=28090 RepID=UPI003F9209D4